MIVNGRAPVRPGLWSEDHSQLRLRYRLAAQASDAYAEAGFTVVVQDVIVGNFLTDFVQALHHQPVFVVVLTPSADAVQRREAQRPKKGYVDGWTVPELDRVLRTQTPPIGL